MVQKGVGIWGSLNLGGVEHPELRRLARLLPTVMMKKWSDNTCKAYLAAFLKFKNWTLQFQGVRGIPFYIQGGAWFLPPGTFFLLSIARYFFFFRRQRGTFFFLLQVHFFYGSICDVKSHIYLTWTSSHEYHL